jgi:hypothetical protein
MLASTPELSYISSPPQFFLSAGPYEVHHSMQWLGKHLKHILTWGPPFTATREWEEEGGGKTTTFNSCGVLSSKAAPKNCGQQSHRQKALPWQQRQKVHCL